MASSNGKLKSRKGAGIKGVKAASGESLACTAAATGQKRVRESAPTESHEARGSEAATPNRFPIVGIGASAGGLEAITHLLKQLPKDTGMGFVVVQHLDPAHESALTQILSRTASMPVSEVTPNVRVEKDHIYVIPPNKNLSIEQGVLKLHPRSKAGGAQRAIDFFFEALAHDQKECAIGVILSGTASDGTVGLEAIKAEDGLTFAQDESAAYDSMPRSAIAAGCVDLVLPPQKIANELARIAKHPSVAEKDERGERASDKAERFGEDKAPQSAERNDLIQILRLLRNHSGVDFSLYKFNTIDRRITRRMVLNKKDTREEYASFLQGNRKELEALYSDVLIGVTAFFRDPEAFEALKRKAFSKLLPRSDEEPVRVWVLGCSTGQEAYSIAMLFVECADQGAGGPKLQIFASDLNDANLEKARAGLYPKSAMQHVSPQRLRRFFVEEKGGYRVIKPLREMCVFARQNLASDPPFSRMDLVSCRNVLIYLESDLQKKMFPAFHYALKPDGFLFLGASETIGSFVNLFEVAEKKHKIFSKKSVPTPALRMPFAQHHPAPKREIAADEPIARLPHVELNAQREADRVLLSRCAPPAVLIDAELQILQFRGDTSPYLKVPVGAATLNVVKMAQGGLMPALLAAINEAKKGNRVTRKENVRITKNTHRRTVNVEIIPLKNLKEQSYLILFEDGREAPHQRARRLDESNAGRRDRGRGATALLSAGEAPPFPASRGEGEHLADLKGRAASHRIADLESELAEARDFAQAHQEENEAANEELQAQSEELQSANEELQSINEELETSKEELESTNEELITVNDEMANRNVELNRLNSDLNNLHVTLNTAIVLLGRDLTVRSFTPLAEKTFKLVTADVGRPLGHIRHNLDFPDLEKFFTEVIDSVSVRQREVQDKQGGWYSLQGRPYMTLDNKIDGAVLMLVDIDALKRSEQEIIVARDYAEGILRTTPQPLVVLTEELRVHTANAAFYNTFKVSPRETEGRSIFELGNRQWQIPKLRQFLEGILPRNSFFDDFEVTHDFENIGQRTLLLNARRLLTDEKHTFKRILLSIHDITEGKQMEAVRLSETRYRRLFEAAKDGVLILEPDTNRITDANPFMTQLLGYTQAELLGSQLCDIGLFANRTACAAAFRELHEKGVYRDDNFLCQPKTGERRALEMVANLYEEAGRQVIQCNIRDITDRKQAEETLRRAMEFGEAVMTNMGEGLYTVDDKGLVTSMNPAAEELFGWRLDELRGKKMHDVTHYKHPDGTAFPAEEGAGFQVLRQGKTLANHEDVFIRKDGTFFDVVSSSSPIRTGNRITGLVVVFRDVTERKRVDRNLTFLVELSNTFAPLATADEIMRVAAEKICRHFSASRVSFGAVNEAGDQLTIFAGRRESGLKDDGGTHRLAEYVSDALLSELKVGTTVAVNDVGSDPRTAPYAAVYEQWGIGSLALAPYLSDGRWKFLLAAHKEVPYAWRADEIKLLQELTVRVHIRLERARAEEGLRENRARLEFALESAQVGDWDLDLSTDKARRSLRHDRCFGYNEFVADWGFEKFIEHVHPEDRAEIERQFRGAVSEVKDWHFECRVVWPDGSVHWIAAHGSIYRADGKPTRMLGTVANITVQKQAEDVLRRHRDSFFHLIEQAPFGVYVIDSQFRIHQVNSGAQRAFVNVRPLIGRDFAEAIRIIWPEPVASEIIAIFRHTLNTGEPYFAPSLTEQRNDVDVVESYEWQTHRITLPNGEFSVVCYFFDSTRLRRTEAELRESAERFRFMAETMPQKIFTAQPSGEVDYFNAQWMEFTGLTFEQIRDSGWTQFIHPDDVEENIRRWKHSIETGDYFELEHRFRRKDGAYRWHLSRAHARRGAEGKVLMWIGSSTDINDQKREEEKLERTVIERTAKLLETVGELEAFSYRIAHDMRAPLRSLQGFGQFLNDEYAGKIDAKGQDYLHRIVTSARRMDRLIQDVLNYSQVVRADLPLEPIDLEKLLKGILESYPALQEEGTTIRLEGPFLNIMGNEAFLTQCFSNLLSNAVKFVAPGTRPAVRVWAEMRANRIRVFVQDNGIGIAPDQHEKIFTIFQRVSKSYDGTGIGLAIVKKAAERMGGGVRLESLPGTGSTFWIELNSANNEN